MRDSSEMKLNTEKLSYGLTFQDVVDILEIIDHSPCRKLDLEIGDLKLVIEKK